MGKKRNTPVPKSSPKVARSSASKGIFGKSDTTLALLLAAFGFLLYVNTLGHEYVLDDDLVFVTNENVHRGFAGILDIFTQPYRDKCLGGCLYRPLALTTFSLDWMIAPNQPMFNHLVNVLWYAFTGMVLFFTLRKLLPGMHKSILWIACIFFMAHPVHTEVVANIKSRDEILSLFFILVSLGQFANWHKRNQWKYMAYAALGFLAALLSKEGAITMVAIYPFIGWIFFQKSFLSSIKSSLWALFPVAIFFVLRGAALEGLTSPAIHMFDNPIVNAHGTERLGTGFYILLKYLQLLVFPLQLSCDYSFDAISLHALTSPMSLLGAVLYVGIGVYALIGLFKKQISAFFAAAFLVSISLYSQIIFLIGTFIGERLLYMPSLWFVLGVATAVSSIFMTDSKTTSIFSWKTNTIYGRSMMVVLAAFLLWFCVHTNVRNKDWKSDYALMKADAAKFPRSIRLVEGYAEEIYKSITNGNITPEQLEQRLTLSEKYSQKANNIKPGISAYTNLANICLSRKNYACALENHKNIIDLSDDKVIANQNVGNMLILWAKEESDKNNNIQLSLDLLHQAFEFKPDDAEIWFGIGLNQFRLGHITAAQSALEKAHQLAPGNTTFKTGLINFYRSQGMNDKADAVQ